jgi:flavin reductase (DIM6/NTAB) family NADH-FMN oxidoreductase RutF
MFKITKDVREGELEARVRARLINCLSGVKNATLVGTKSKEGLANVAVFSSVFHLGADPALMGIVFRPVPGDTLKNILESKSFTLNHLSSSFSQSIHHTSARFEESEFSECGITEEYLDNFEAPFVKESLVKWSMNFLRMIDIPENGTHLMIAEVEDIYLSDKSLMREDGSLAIEEATCAVLGLDAYFQVSAGHRYSYAKPDKKPSRLK